VQGHPERGRGTGVDSYGEWNKTPEDGAATDKNRKPTGTGKRFFAFCWIVVCVAAITVVCFFVFAWPAPVPEKGFLALPRVETFVKDVEQLGQIKNNMGQVYLQVDRLRELARTADSKKGDEIKSQVASLAQTVEEAVKSAESDWKKDVAEKSTSLVTDSKKLSEETAELRNALKSLSIEEIQGKASLLSSLLLYIFLGGLVVTLFLEIRSGFSEAFENLRNQAKQELNLFVDLEQVTQHFNEAVRAIIADIKKRDKPLVVDAKLQVIEA